MLFVLELFDLPSYLPQIQYICYKVLFTNAVKNLKKTALKQDIQGDPKKRAPILIRPHFLVFCPNEMKLWS